MNGMLPAEGTDTFDDVVLHDALLQGAVLDAEHGTPVPGASIKFYQHNLHWATGQADRRGCFSFRLPPGQFTLRITNPPHGYVRMTEAEAVHVNLRDGKNGPITVKIHKSLTLTGKVTDEQGRPVPGVGFFINVFGDRNEFDTYVTFRSDTHGKFTVSGLYAGRGDLCVDSEQYRKPFPWNFACLSIRLPADHPITVSLTHLASHSVCGRVLDVNRHPLTGVTAHFWVAYLRNGQPFPVTVVTGKDGGYRLIKIPVGQPVYLHAIEKFGYRWPTTHELTNAGAGDTVEDAVMESCTATVRGKVCDAGGKQVPGAAVISVEGGLAARAVTDESGVFTLSAQPECELHLVAATPTGGGPAMLCAGTDNRLTCTPGNIVPPSDISLVLKLLEVNDKLANHQSCYIDSEVLRTLADVDLDTALRLATSGGAPIPDGLHAYLLARQAENDPAKVGEFLAQLNCFTTMPASSIPPWQSASRWQKPIPTWARSSIVLPNRSTTGPITASPRDPGRSASC